MATINAPAKCDLPGACPTRLERAKMGKRTPAERFWEKVDRNGPIPEYAPNLGPCWLWTASVTTSGYGTFTHRRSDGGVAAHRFCYEQLVGLIPAGLELDHLCRVRRCVNPAHLEAVTHRENMRRGQSPANVLNRLGVCKRGHDLSEDGYHRNGERLYCRICHREAQRRYKARRKQAVAPTTSEPEES